MKKTLLFIAVIGLVFTACKKEGCTDSTATNYDENAVDDDGSCLYVTSTDTSSNVNVGTTDTTTTADTTTTKTYEHIVASFLDSSKWTKTWLLPFSDSTMGFDFSANNFVDSLRDGYLNMSTMTFENKSIFNGENKVKSLGNLDLSGDYKIMKQWDASNSKLVVGEFYLVQCLDGYAIFHVVSFMTCCNEYEISFVHVPTKDIVTK